MPRISRSAVMVDEIDMEQIKIPVIGQPFGFGIQRFVHELDMWHDEAFEGTPAEGKGHKGIREKKWYAEDFSGNLVAELTSVPCLIGDKIINKNGHIRIVKEIEIVYEKDKKLWLWNITVYDHV